MHPNKEYYYFDHRTFLKVEWAQYVTKHVLAYAMSRRLEPSVPARLPWPLVGLPHPADLGAEQSEEPPGGKVLGGEIGVRQPLRVGHRRRGESFCGKPALPRARAQLDNDELRPVLPPLCFCVSPRSRHPELLLACASLERMETLDRRRSEQEARARTPVSRGNGKITEDWE
jgi:hypothetical protein